jgi:uncharacterized membrane protein
MRNGQMLGWIVLRVMTERSFPMGQQSASSRITVLAGTGMAVGAALGLLFGLMLLESVFVGVIVGAVVGAAFGLGWELQSRREQTD